MKFKEHTGEATTDVEMLMLERGYPISWLKDGDFCQHAECWGMDTQFIVLECGGTSKKMEKVLEMKLVLSNSTTVSPRTIMTDVDVARGKVVDSAPWAKRFNNGRINEHHLSFAEKKSARGIA